MISIGIDNNQGFVYEGSGHYGRAIWPTPFVTPAKFVFLSDGDIKAESSSSAHGYRFREDSFDPIARIRRGRFYYANDGQSIEWHVQPHPAVPLEAWGMPGGSREIKKILETFNGNQIWHKYVENQRELPLVFLGVDGRFTVWRIIDIEAISTGEDLVTLRARSSLGILPSIKSNKIPESFKSKLNETLGTFVDEVHRSSPVSVIDRARDAATYVLLAYFNLQSGEAKDLGKLIKRLEEKKLIIAMNTAQIIARLHARAKPSEQENHELRAIREQDAELAVQCFGTLLCELDFAEWN